MLEAIPAIGTPNTLRFIKEKFIAGDITSAEAVASIMVSVHKVTPDIETLKIAEVGKHWLLLTNSLLYLRIWKITVHFQTPTGPGYEPQSSGKPHFPWGCYARLWYPGGQVLCWETHLLCWSCEGKPIDDINIPSIIITYRMNEFWWIFKSPQPIHNLVVEAVAKGEIEELVLLLKVLGNAGHPASLKTITKLLPVFGTAAAALPLRVQADAILALRNIAKKEPRMVGTK